MKKVARPMPTSLPQRLLSILRMRTAYRNFVETCLLVARSPEYATLDSADADRLQLSARNQIVTSSIISSAYLTQPKSVIEPVVYSHWHSRHVRMDFWTTRNS